MANVIKHKRGSGSDPVASDLVVGEVAIRTDVGKLFTKMDNGSVAEIAGGGSDIAINTLSSSSGTGGGSATFNGSAYRFTLSQPPSVSAQQLLVSINGVIQKPVAGTGQPSEGFSVDGTDIILGDAPATGSDFFILTFKSLGVSEPADNSVTSAKIVDGAILNADINASAAIAGTKISPDFGSQNITTSGDLTVTGTGTSATFKSTDNNYIVQLQGNNATNKVFIGTTSSNDFLFANGSGVTERLRIDSSGRMLLNTTVEGNESADDLTISSISGSGGITIRTGTSNNGSVFFSDATSGAAEYAGFVQYQHSSNSLLLGTASTTRMTIDSSGKVGIGTTSPGSVLHVDKGLSGSPLVTFHQTNGNSSADAGLEVETSSTGTYIQRWVNSGSEKMRVTGNGLVGIGTASPSSHLEVVGGTGVNLLLNAATHDASTANQARLQLGFVHSGGQALGHIRLDEAASNSFDGILRLGVPYNNQSGGSSTREVIEADFNGNICFPGSTTVFDTTARTNGLQLYYETDSGIATIASHSSGGNTRLDLGTNSSGGAVGIAMTIRETGNIGIGTTSPTDKLHVVGTTNLAGNSYLTNAYVSGNVYLGGTGSANALEDYEEGTFTPTATFESSDSGNKAYHTQSGSYTKVGRLVYCNIVLVLSNRGTGSGRLRFNGLPFTVGDNLSGTILEASATVGYFAELVSSVSDIKPVAIQGTDQMVFYGILGQYGSNTGDFGYSHVGNSFSIRLSITYQV